MANELDQDYPLAASEAIELAHDLVDSLENDDMDAAQLTLAKLDQLREDGLYKQLGQLTRELHESLKEIDVGVTNEDIPTARSRLNYVIELTEDAANKTMDGIESTLPISDMLSKDAKSLFDEWSKFRRRELSLEQFQDLYKEMMVFLENVEGTAATIHHNLQEILVAQNYQDLTGQAIKKVMHTVSILENKLVELVRVSTDARRAVGVEEEQEEVQKKEVSTNLSSQEDVDALLKEAGF